MKWRYGFLVCCAVLIMAAGATVTSGREAAAICCESAAGCPTGQVCCDPEGLGTGPCSEEFLIGYCRETCKVGGALTFTADQK